MVSVRRVSSESKKTRTANGAERKAPTTAGAPTVSTSMSSLRKPRTKSSRAPRAARRASLGSSAAWTAWNRNSGTRAMMTPVESWVTRAFSASDVLQQAGGDRPGVEEGGGEHRAGQQPAEVRRELAPRRLGPRLEHVVLAPARDQRPATTAGSPTRRP